MPPSTQVSLIALVLFFVVAGVSIAWPHLAGLDRSRSSADRINARTRALHELPLAKALREAETTSWSDLPPQIRTRALYLGTAALLITVIVIGVQLYYATPPQLVQRTHQ